MFVLQEPLMLTPVKELADAGFQDALRSVIDENRRGFHHRMFVGVGWLATVLVGVALASLLLRGTIEGLVIGCFGLTFLAIAVGWGLLGLRARATKRAYEELLVGRAVHTIETGHVERVSRWKIAFRHRGDVSVITWKDADREQHTAYVDFLAARHLKRGETVAYASDPMRRAALFLGPRLAS